MLVQKTALRLYFLPFSQRNVLSFGGFFKVRMGERSVRIREVEGSNPFRSTNTIESEPFADWPWVRIYCFVRRPGIIFPAAA